MSYQLIPQEGSKYWHLGQNQSFISIRSHENNIFCLKIKIWIFNLLPTLLQGLTTMIIIICSLQKLNFKIITPIASVQPNCASAKWQEILPITLTGFQSRKSQIYLKNLTKTPKCRHNQTISSKNAIKNKQTKRKLPSSKHFCFTCVVHDDSVWIDRKT